jgi:gentisate 1,2-dioxygenase
MMEEAEFRAELRTANVSPLWDVLEGLVTETPKPKAGSHQWPYSELRKLLMKAGEQITAEKAERRVLVLENPNLEGASRATDALYAGLQLVLKDEIAPAHRHTQSALRFVLESEGAWTSVDGERVSMQPFDLVLTPNWRWHEHGCSGGTAIWLDGLDIPTIQHFTAGFAEREGNVPSSQAMPSGTCVATHGSGLRPVTAGGDERNGCLFHYPYATWRKALEGHSRAYDADPHTGWAMEFVNPVDAGAVMGTISAFCQKLTARTRTRLRRQSASAVYCGVEGQGVLIVDGIHHQIGPCDVVAVPSWAGLEIEAGSDDLVFFNYSDRVCHEKLGFWREERL